MWPFKRKEKQVYFILWSMCDPGAVFTDYISAVNSEKAWKKLRRKWHCPNAILRKIEVYDNEG